MSLKWTDVLEIAIQLAETKPDVDPLCRSTSSICANG